MASTDYCEELAGMAGIKTEPRATDDPTRPVAKETHEHLICFAKGHYGAYGGELRYEAMRHMLSKVLLLEFAHINQRDMIHLLTRACNHYSQFQNRPISDLIIEIAGTSFWQPMGNSVPVTAFLDKLLGYLASTQVYDGGRELFEHPRFDQAIHAHVTEKMTKRLQELARYEREQQEVQSQLYRSVS